MKKSTMKEAKRWNGPALAQASHLQADQKGKRAMKSLITLSLSIIGEVPQWGLAAHVVTDHVRPVLTEFPYPESLAERGLHSVPVPLDTTPRCIGVGRVSRYRPSGHEVSRCTSRLNDGTGNREGQWG